MMGGKANNTLVKRGSALPPIDQWCKRLKWKRARDSAERLHAFFRAAYIPECVLLRLDLDQAQKTIEE